MKLPHPFCGGLCGLVYGAVILAAIHTFSGYIMVLVYFQRVTLLSNQNNGVEIQSSYSTISNIFIGLIFNLIVNAVLIAGLFMEHLTALRIWLVLGLVGCGVWNYAIYDIASHDNSGLQRQLPHGISSFIIAAIICHAYVWYVMYAFTRKISQPKVNVLPLPRTGVPALAPGVIVITNPIMESQAADGDNESKICTDFPPNYSDIARPTAHDVATLGIQTSTN